MNDDIALHGLEKVPEVRWFHRRRLRNIRAQKTATLVVYARRPLFVVASRASQLFPIVLGIDHSGGSSQLSITQPDPWDSLTTTPIQAGNCVVRFYMGDRSITLERVVRSNEILLVYARSTFGIRSKKSCVHNVYYGIVKPSQTKDANDLSP